MNISEVGKNIKKYREEKGWSLNRLKEECSIGYATLHDIENGKSKSLNSGNLEKVASALGVTTDELLGVEVIEYTVCDLDKTLEYVLKSEELTVDDITINENEKQLLQDIFSAVTDIIRKQRQRNNNNKEESN